MRLLATGRRWLARRDRWPLVSLLAASLIALSILFFANDYAKPAAALKPTTRYRPYLASADGHKLYLYARSLAIDHDLDVTNEVAMFGYEGGIRHTEDGRPYFPHEIGPPLVWTPLLAVAQDLAMLGDGLGLDVSTSGYGRFQQRFVLYSSVLFAVLAVVLGWLLARRLIGGAVGPPLAALAVLFGTSIYYYATYLPSYSHAMDAAACAVFLALWGLGVGRLHWTRFVWLGAALGLCGLIRVSGLAIGIVVAVELGWRAVRPEPGDPRGRARWRFAAGLAARGGVALAVCLAVYTIQMIAWKVELGEALTSPNGPGYVHLGRPFLAEFLWSSRNGFLSTHPIAYAGVVGLFLLPRRHRMIGVALLVAVAVQAYVNSCVYDWWGMASFGARRMCGVTVILVVGLAALIRAVGLAWARLPGLRRAPMLARRGLAVVVMAWFMTWNIAFAEAFRHGRIEKNPPHPMCCKVGPGFMRAIARPIYERLGNPFALPASAVWGHLHEVPWRRWDQVVGAYAARPHFRDLLDGTADSRKFDWNLPGDNFEPFLLGGFAPPQRVGRRRFRWVTGDHAALLVPLFLPCGYRFQVPVRPNLGTADQPMRVQLVWNGEVVVDRTVSDQWTTLAFVVTPEQVERMNVLELRGEPAPYRLNPAAQTRDQLLPPRGGATTASIAVRALGINTVHARR